MVNQTPQSVLQEYLLKSKKAKKAFLALPPPADETVTEANRKRSVKVMYSNGLLSKRKYQSIRNAELEILKTCKHVGRPTIPPMLKYSDLIQFMNNLDMGTLTNLDDVRGCRRDLAELLEKLAFLYLVVDEYLEFRLLSWFSNPTGTFLVSLSGDGAPFGKNECSTALLVSILNVKHLVASPDHNILLFGGNCTETDINFINLVRQMVDQMSRIEEQAFKVHGVDVKFRLALAPSDMKFVALLAGELTNSANYPCTFAQVQKGDFTSLEIAKSWKPWSYEQRMIAAAKVQKFKMTLPITLKSSRAKITKFISDLKSRQEFPPVIGKYVDMIKAEPLHLKNNAWQQWHMLIFREALVHTSSKSLDATLEIQQLSDSVFKRYYMMLKTLRLGKVAKKIATWFKEDRRGNKPLELRFTGEESLKLSRNFMQMISVLYSDELDQAAQCKVHILAFIGLHLRESVALFSRFNITEDDIVKLEKSCELYYRASALFLNVTLTTWTIGNVVPKHVRDCYDKFGLGLAINTMHGREAKHLRLKDYTKKATVANRWQTAFRHEYMSTVWLLQSDPSSLRANLSSEEYTHKEFQNHIPEKFINDTEYCYCGLYIGTEPCKFCSALLRQDIQKSCELGKIKKSLRF